MLALLLVVAVAVAGYLERDFLTAQWGSLKTRFFGGDAPTASTVPADTARPEAPRGDTARPGPATPARPRPSAPQYPAGTRPLRDEPYVSDDTGTIAPGMTERDVYSLWGPPVGVRRAGEWTYLYFRNGCEYSCGTYDVVFLQNGLVVDAILRWPGHGYSGQSSSPPGVVPLPTRGGDTLVVRPPSPDS
ncbi:MAG TPA: hypothetical protein VNI61_07340 [Gemmatimonadales bacterium]|nr:hypothetical protein [Gemmatimonadales bacterium]